MNPILEAQVVVNEHIGGIKRLNLPYCWLKIMRFNSYWNQNRGLYQIPTYFLYKLIKGKEG
jgi:hypothetical protein